jgi:hypothetical protein
MVVGTQLDACRAQRLAQHAVIAGLPCPGARRLAGDVPGRGAGLCLGLEWARAVAAAVISRAPAQLSLSRAVTGATAPGPSLGRRTT